MRGRQRFSGLWPGLILVGVGGGLLARELGVVPEHVRIVDFWPLFVVIMGISSLLRAQGFVRALFSLAFIAMGAVLLAGNLGFLTFPAARLWPGLLILLGLSVVVGGRRGPFHGPRPFPPGGGRWGRYGGWSPEPNPNSPEPSPNSSDTSISSPNGPNDDFRAHRPHGAHGPHGAQPSGADTIVQQFSFSGAQVRIESQAWKGGELGVTAGGVELDLRHARLAPEGAHLDVRVLMGGVDIRVPDTWQVHCEVTPLFAGADDTTRSTQGSTTAPRLRVTGAVTLGGVTIRN